MTTYHVQSVSRPYADAVPEDAWTTKLRTRDKTRAIRMYRKLRGWYNPTRSNWSGHVRIVGDDGLEYEEYFDDSGSSAATRAHLIASYYSQFDAKERAARLAQARAGAHGSQLGLSQGLVRFDGLDQTAPDERIGCRESALDGARRRPAVRSGNSRASRGPAEALRRPARQSR